MRVTIGNDFVTVCAGIFLLSLTPATRANAQGKQTSRELFLELSGSVAMLNTAVRDEAYSGAAYAGWLPAGALRGRLQHGKYTHMVLMNITKGHLTHQLSDYAPMALSGFDISYRFLWNPGEKAIWEGVTFGLGPGVTWSTIQREYEGFINDRARRDYRGGLSLAGTVHLPVGRAKRFGLAASGSLGLVGFFNLASNWPESTTAGLYPDRTSVVWMPGGSAFCVDFSIAAQYRVSSRHRLDIAYFLDGVKWDVSPFWGALRRGPAISYYLTL